VQPAATAVKVTAVPWTDGDGGAAETVADVQVEASV